MNDRFKFRIIAEKEVKTINGTFKGQSIYYCNGFIQTKLKTYFFGNNKKYSFLNSEIKAINQCTGLKDKKDKLIYEGDIVEKSTFIDYNGNGYQPDVYLDRVDIGAVHFTASNGAVIRRVKTFLTDDPYEKKAPLPKQEQPKMVKLIASRCEIIGNIYENGELLCQE